MVRVPDILRTQIFRLTVLISGLFGILAFFLFFFITWRTGVVETGRVDRLLIHDAEIIAASTPEDVRYAVRTHIALDLHHISTVSLFSAQGSRLIGNLPAIPEDLPFDGLVHRVAFSDTEGAPAQKTARMVARRLPDDTVLVIGRNVDSLANLEVAVWRTLELGVLPCVLLSLLVGSLVAHRSLQQVQHVHRTVERIMHGNLHERLPTRGGGGDFDQLAASVNHMLDEIGRLLDEVKSTGDNIAHDLRTPLTRVRARLERARDSAGFDELRTIVDRTLDDLDQTLRIITGLLRIGEIEGGRRRAAFHTLDPATIVLEVSDLYAPLAEEKQVKLVVEAAACQAILGDRDLLSEALANILDNAIKYSPAGGTVRVSLCADGQTPVIQVADNGPGIPAGEREAVLRRLYRTDKSRHVEGFGLGLSIVEAVIKLHGFHLAIQDGHPGCIFEIHCGAKG